MRKNVPLDPRDLRLTAYMRRISILQIAQRTGIPYDRVQRLFRCVRAPKPGELELIAEAVGIAASAVHADPESREGASPRDTREVREPQVAQG
jgi:hypothetical protein